MVIECVAAAAASVVITAFYGAQARRLFSRFCSFVFASFFLFSFVFGLFVCIFFFVNFRVELASRARWRAATECGITPVDEPTHLLGPLVDDHLIYCNITHTRTIKRAAETLNGELKRGEKKKCWTAGFVSAALLEHLRRHLPLEFRRF